MDKPNFAYPHSASSERVAIINIFLQKCLSIMVVIIVIIFTGLINNKNFKKQTKNSPHLEYPRPVLEPMDLMEGRVPENFPALPLLGLSDK